VNHQFAPEETGGVAVTGTSATGTNPED